MHPAQPVTQESLERLIKENKAAGKDVPGLEAELEDMKNQKEFILRPCFSWKCQGQEREFVRIVAAQIAEEFWHSDRIGPNSGGSYLVLNETKLPLAYCSECGQVIFVGPTLREVQEEFLRKNQERDKKAMVIQIPTVFSDVNKALKDLKRKKNKPGPRGGPLAA